jgi:transcription initiation factor TFIID subunit 6
MIPPVLTCLIGRHLGPTITSPLQLDHFELRDLAASLLKHLCTRYAKISSNLKPRLARSLLKTFLDPKKPLGSHYGAILGLGTVGGGSATNEIVRSLIVPNLKAYGEVLRSPLDGSDGDIKKAEADRVMGAIVHVLRSDKDEDAMMTNGTLTNGVSDPEQTRKKLFEVVGETFGSKLYEIGDEDLVKATIEFYES